MGPLCKQHPRQAAGWRCDHCRAYLCPDCVYVSRFGTTELVGCTLCSNRVELLLAHRKQRTFASRIPHALTYPFSVGGVLTLLGTGFAAWVMLHAGCLGTILGLGMIWGTLFTVIRQSSDGRDEIMLDFSDLWSDIGYPALAGVVGTAFVWVPPAIYVYERHGVTGLMTDPIWWLLLVLGILYAPMAIVVAATKSPFFSMLNPVLVLGYAYKLGTDYLLAVVMLVLLAVAELVGGVIVGILMAKLLPDIPLVTSWIELSVFMIGPIIAAHLLGVLLLTRGDTIGWGDAREFQEPLLKDAVPRGTAPPAKQEPASSPRSHAPIEIAGLDGVEPPPPEKARSHAPIEIEGLEGLGGLEPPPPGPAAKPEPEKPAPPTPAQAIERAVSGNDVDAALKLYEANGLVPELAPQLHLTLGQAAVSRNKLELAVKALRAAAKNPAAPETPRAMVMLGRVYAEKMNDVATANKVFSYVVQNFPGTPAAQFAQARLAPKA